MDRRAVEEFVGRDCHAIAVSKAAYWAERFKQDGWQPAWAAADALLLDMHRTRPDYPTDHDRDRDFADHLKLRARPGLRRACVRPSLSFWPISQRVSTSFM